MCACSARTLARTLARAQAPAYKAQRFVVQCALKFLFLARVFEHTGARRRRRSHRDALYLRNAPMLRQTHTLADNDDICFTPTTHYTGLLLYSLTWHHTHDAGLVRSTDPLSFQYIHQCEPTSHVNKAPAWTKLIYLKNPLYKSSSEPSSRGPHTTRVQLAPRPDSTRANPTRTQVKTTSLSLVIMKFKEPSVEATSRK